MTKVEGGIGHGNTRKNTEENRKEPISEDDIWGAQILREMGTAETDENPGRPSVNFKTCPFFRSALQS